MKTLFEDMELELITFGASDVIATSGDPTDNDFGEESGGFPGDPNDEYVPS